MDIEALADAAFAPSRQHVRGRPHSGRRAGTGDRGRAAGRARVTGARHNWSPTGSALARDTWFDLASLTKVIFTTTAILKLADAGRIELDAPLTSVIPDLHQYDMSAAERRLTFRQPCSRGLPYRGLHLPSFPRRCRSIRSSATPGAAPTLATLRALRAASVGKKEWRGPARHGLSTLDINFFILLGIALERDSWRPAFAIRAVPDGLSWRRTRRRTAATSENSVPGAAV